MLAKGRRTLSSISMMISSILSPDSALEPTAVGAVSSAFAVHDPPRWRRVGDGEETDFGVEGVLAVRSGTGVNLRISSARYDCSHRSDVWALTCASYLCPARVRLETVKRHAS
jgi:hypothetical protein